MSPILIDEYDYPLTDDRIAKYPLSQRDHSKLLIYKDRQIAEDHFYNIGKYLLPQPLLVYNNTRVIQARMVFHKPSGARIEIFCLEPVEPRDYQLALGSTDSCTWKCMIGNRKKWKEGLLSIQDPSGGNIVNAELLEEKGNTYLVRFSWSQADTSFAEILDALGELPIPPYLNRPTEESDKTTYQTVYSRIKGSVAAPTAGLHFTTPLLQSLKENGTNIAEVTLHVGAGTFQPVKTADANLHKMHTEIIAVPLTSIYSIRNNIGHIVAVGTTSMRTLESLYWLGRKLLLSANPQKEEMNVEQFEPYAEQQTYVSTRDALNALIDYLQLTHQDTLHAQTQIMIRPGYTFRVIKQLITNFHQPRSTLLLLVSAFVSGNWKQIYDYALSHQFRFLSYGDSSVLTTNNYHD